MKRPFVPLFFALVLLLPILFMGAFVAAAGNDVSPSDKAMREVPSDLLPIYRAAAATCDGMEWTLLAAIHKVETGFGRGGAVSSAGAQGPMQFMPATWTAYATDGDGDGVARINDVEDAIFSAASLLCANGAGDPSRLAAAVFSYNHSESYVAEVLSLAASYGVVTFGEATASASAGDILRNPRIMLTANARADVEAGVVDTRLLALLQAISVRHSIGISVFKIGHSKYTESGSVSLHFYGRGVDIFFIDGEPVSFINKGAQQLVLDLAGLSDGALIDEVGHPFPLIQFPGGFSDRDHADHIHVGVRQ